jgi:hypothetical protein
MEHQTLVRFRWAILGGGVSLFLSMAHFVAPFHYPVPVAVLIGLRLLLFVGLQRVRTCGSRTSTRRVPELANGCARGIGTPSSTARRWEESPPLRSTA